MPVNFSIPRVLYGYLLLALSTHLYCANGTEVRWIWRHTGSSRENLVYGGQEGTDPDPTYICRALIAENGEVANGRDSAGGRFVPGKFVPYYDTCYVAPTVTSGEKAARTFQVLLNDPPNRYKWEKVRNFWEKNSVVGGSTSMGKPIYICRTRSTPVQKWFWSGTADLVGNTAGHNDCTAPWHSGVKSYGDFDILVDTLPICVPQEKWVTLFSYRNNGDSDQSVSKEYSVGVERKEETSETTRKSKTMTEESGFTAGANVKGIKAEFSSKVGTSSMTGYDWTRTNANIWRSSTKHTYPLNVKMGTHAVLKQLVGYCGDFQVETEELEATSKKINSNRVTRKWIRI